MRKVIVWVSFALLFTCFYHLPKASASELNFSVNATGSNAHGGYYQLNVKPHFTYTLPVTITNISDRAITVMAAQQNALTSIYGGIQYVNYTHGLHTSLLDTRYALKNKINGPKVISLQPHESKIITYQVTSSDLTGVELGGLLFKESSETSSHQKKRDGTNFTTQNQVSRVIPIQLNYPKSEQKKVTISQPVFDLKGSNPIIFIPLRNERATITDNLSGNYAVYKKNKRIFEGKLNVNAFKMAPKTEIGYPLSWSGKTITDGKYHIKMTLHTGNQIIKKNFELHVPKETLVTYQKEQDSHPIVTMNNRILFVVIGVLVLIILILGCFLLRKFNKKSDKKE